MRIPRPRAGCLRASREAGQLARERRGLVEARGRAGHVGAGAKLLGPQGGRRRGRGTAAGAFDAGGGAWPHRQRAGRARRQPPRRGQPRGQRDRAGTFR